LTDQVRHQVKHQTTEHPDVRLTGVLRGLGIAVSSWYHAGVPAGERKRPGPKGKPIPWWTEQTIVTMAVANPWYGYKRIAVMCRRAGHGVRNRQCYRVMKQHDLLQKRRPRAAEIYQAAKLWQLLPQGPNDLWQMDVTYIHIPGYGWWYAVTVIDYFSRYLLACYLTDSYSASAVTTALAEAKREAERLHGSLTRTPFLVTDNGTSFVAKKFSRFVKGQFTHVRIAYRTPTQLGLLERFHRTLKQEEVYWRLYDHPAHARACLAEFRDRYNEHRPHWALIPEDGGDPLTPEDVYLTGLAVQIPKWQGWAKKAKEQLDQMMTQDAA
jgi:transposase InsO family protein